MSAEYAIEAMKRNRTVVLFAALLSAAGLLMYAVPLAGLFRAAYRDETFSYIVFIPPVSLYLVYEERKRIFTAEYGSLLPGIVLVSLGVILFLAARTVSVGSSIYVERFGPHSLSAVPFLCGVFGLIVGTGGLRAAPQYFTDNTPLVPSRDLQGYEIYIKEDPSFGPADSPVATPSPFASTYNLANVSPSLSKGVTYYVSLRTVTVDGIKSDFSPATSFSIP